MTLFDPGPPDPQDPEPEPMSYTRRLTLQRQADLARGLHPTTRVPLLDPLDPAKRCGTCEHHVAQGANRTYHKCLAVPFGVTNGPATDVRVGWPACTKWTPDASDEGEGHVSASRGDSAQLGHSA